jgi:sulfur-oxidizing protein SoxY
MPTRRDVLCLGAVVLCTPAAAASGPLLDAMRAFAGTGGWREGRVTLDIAPLVENGNAVPVSVRVQSAMSGSDQVRTIAILTERNPQPEVAVFQLGAHVGRAEVATRIRLATTQNICAMARMADGSCWVQQMEVIVTLASCLE